MSLVGSADFKASSASLNVTLERSDSNCACVAAFASASDSEPILGKFGFTIFTGGEHESGPPLTVGVARGVEDAMGDELGRGAH